MSSVLPIQVLTTVLKQRFPGLAADSKYLLAFVCVHLQDTPQSITETELAKKAGMPLGAFRQGRQELIDQGYAEPFKSAPFRINQANRGRFRRGFVLRSEVYQEIRQQADRLNLRNPTLGLAMMRCVLGGSQGQLLLPNMRHRTRLLMGVLMALSDDFGVVRGASMAKLKGLTGLTTGQVASQVRMLKRRKFILMKFRGVNGVRICKHAPGGMWIALDWLDRNGLPVVQPGGISYPGVSSLEVSQLLLSNQQIVWLLPFRDILNGQENIQLDNPVPNIMKHVVFNFFYKKQGIIEYEAPEHERVKLNTAFAQALDLLCCRKERPVALYLMYKVLEYAAAVFNETKFQPDSKGSKVELQAISPDVTAQDWYWIDRICAEIAPIKTGDKELSSWLVGMIVYYYAREIATMLRCRLFRCKLSYNTRLSLIPAWEGSFEDFRLLYHPRSASGNIIQAARMSIKPLSQVPSWSFPGFSDGI